MTIQAYFDGGVLVPHEPLHLRPGTCVEVVVDSDELSDSVSIAVSVVAPVIVGLDPELSHAIAGGW